MYVVCTIHIKSSLKISKHENERKHPTYVLLKQIILFQTFYNVAQKNSTASRDKKLSAKVFFFLFLTPHPIDLKIYKNRKIHRAKRFVLNGK